MSVTLTPEQERTVSDWIASGRFPSEEAVIGEALAALREKEEREARRTALLSELNQGFTSLDAGLGRPLTRDVIEQLKMEGRSRRAERETGHG
jgi:putative addiction module CopG family antidote